MSALWHFTMAPPRLPPRPLEPLTPFRPQELACYRHFVCRGSCKMCPFVIKWWLPSSVSVGVETAVLSVLKIVLLPTLSPLHWNAHCVCPRALGGVPGGSESLLSAPAFFLLFFQPGHLSCGTFRLAGSLASSVQIRGGAAALNIPLQLLDSSAPEYLSGFFS